MTPPVNPNPSSSLPQQEKRWTVVPICGGWNIDFGNGKAIWTDNETLSHAVVVAHNATLSEPKPEVKEECNCATAQFWVRCPIHDLVAPDAPADNAQAVLQNAFQWLLGAEHQSRSCHQPFGAGYTPCVCGLADVRKSVQAILSPTGVREHAMGVSSDEEIAREAALELNRRNAFRVSLALGTKVILAAIRKAKSLSEPKESEEKGSNL